MPTDQQWFNRQIWHDALVNGNYEQGTGNLREMLYNEFQERGDVVGHCCLGVALDVLVDGDWVENSYHVSSEYPVLPESQHAGLMDESLWLHLFGEDMPVQTDFSNANDNEGLSFAEIAKMIPLKPVESKRSWFKRVFYRYGG